jgi:ATP-dependent helicase/nuclease subunit B
VEQAYRAISQRSQYSLGKVSSSNIHSLYGKTLNLSASQIDRLAECRLSYFLKYGLRAKERKEATVDPAEFGTYVHAVLENTCRDIKAMGGFHQVSLEQTLDIAHKHSDAYAAEHFSQIESERMTYLFRRNARELDMVVGELWEELKDSLFQPQGFEVSFGKKNNNDEDRLPEIVIPNKAMDASLQGFVDRMDTWEHNGNTYYRIVDYKTGPKEFDYCDVFNGIGLQMLLYMFALRESGEEHLGDRPIPVGVQYFPARARFLNTDGRPEEEDAEKKRLKEWRREGLLLQDEEILKAMEPGDEIKRLNYKVKKDGSLDGDLASREQMKLLERYVFRTLGKLVEEIASGDVSPNPYTRGDHGACTWCPYGSICHKADVAGRRNYKTMSAQRFWDEVGKEMGHGG